MDQLFYLAMSLTLFLIVNLLGRHISSGYVQLELPFKEEKNFGFNVFYRIATPIVFILILSGLLVYLGHPRITNNIFLIVIYYLIFRLLFNVAIGRFKLLNWKKELILSFSIGFISLLIQKKVIDIRDFHFPTPQTITDYLWLGVAAFIYQTLNDFSYTSTNNKFKKENYIKSKYFSFKKKYGNLINENLNNPDLINLFYSIMVYENYNRPPIVRVVENIVFKIFPGSRTLGLMQIKTSNFINDYESVRLAINKINSDCIQFSIDWKDFIQKSPSDVPWRLKSEIISKYNGGEKYKLEITNIEYIINKITKMPLPGK